MINNKLYNKLINETISNLLLEVMNLEEYNIEKDNFF